MSNISALEKEIADLKTDNDTTCLLYTSKAEWLYELPQWDDIFTPERKHELYLEQKKSGTVVKEDKVYPNDPCPCGSGKKYKKCCGKNQ